MALYANSLTLNSSLREFRILVLFARESSDDLWGELLEALLDNGATSYTALSYTWGDPSDPAFIDLDHGQTLLPITRNLEAALRQLRLPTVSLSLWVDAIFINQADPEEKNGRVALMRDIDIFARQTWVWLGPSSTDSDLAMDALLGFQKRHPSHNELRQIRQDTWDGIGNVMRRSWWTRVWVIQEVLSSMRVYVWCGHRRIDSVCFVKLEDICRNFAFKHIPTHPFANILFNWSLNQQINICTAGFIIPSRDAIVPDYSNRTSDALLSTQATAHFLIQLKRLLPLQSGFYKKADSLDLPSWVSDWSTSEAGYITLVFESTYHACGQYTTTVPRFEPQFEHLSNCPENASLVLKGVIEGEIDTALPMPEVPLYTGSDTEGNLRSRMLRRKTTKSTCRA
ncbi:MAG: hypothetical protein L6R38_000261 [Xanthoria sp. 2 TBL-2021]|nr:MAG: hypothetical protein L6R38_000261 [Xanthoria sp. 2 TBL-2021]